MQFMQFTAARADTGATLPLAKATVYLTGTSTKAPLFDNTGTGISNPVTASTVGLVSFAAADGIYDIAIQSADGLYNTPTMVGVQIFDLSAMATSVALIPSKAPIASPTFTGTPAAPTASVGTNTTQLATTGFVTAAIGVLTTGADAAHDSFLDLQNLILGIQSTASALATTVGGKLTAASNLSDLANVASARQNLGVRPGIDVLAFSANMGAMASGAAWTSGLQVPVYSAANTVIMKTIGTAAGNLLDRAAGDALYAPIGSGGGGVVNGTYGDIIVTGGGATWTVGTSTITYGKIQNAAAAGLMGATAAGSYGLIPLGAGMAFSSGGALVCTVSNTGLSRNAVATIARTQALNAVREAAAASIPSTVTTDTVYGGVSYDSFDGTAGQSFAQILSHGTGVLKQVRLRFGAAATGFIDIIRPSTGAILQSFSVSASGSGVTTVTISGSYVLPVDAVVAYRAVTGAQIRYAAGSASHYYYTSSDASDGNVTLATDTGALLSIEYTVAVPQAISGGATVSTVYGSVVPDASNGVSGQSFGLLISHAGGPLTQVRVRLASSGTGKIDIVNSAGIILQSFDVTASAAGLVTLNSFGGYVLPADAIVAYRAVSGALIRDAAGPGSIYYYTSSDASDNVVALSTDTGVQIALEYTVAVTPTGGTYPVAILDGSGWNGLITYGQSLSSGLSANNAVSTTQPYSNLTFGSGVRSSKPGNGHSAGNTSPGTTTTKPLIEDNTSGAGSDGVAGESLCSGAANWAVTLTATQQGVLPANFVIFGSCAGHGGYTMAQLVKGTAWYPQLTDQVAEMTARAGAAGKTAKVIAVPWMQGENDAVSGTTRTAYTTGFKMLADAMNGDIKALTSQADDVHVLTYQTASGGSSSLAALNLIQLAQLDSIAQHPRIHLASPIYHLMAGSPEGVHLGPIGQLRYGRYVGRAFYQLCVERREPDCIRILSATAKGTALTIRFDVPTAPLVMDSFIPVATNNGFKVVDDTGTLTISSIAVGTDGTSVTMTLNRSLTTNPKVRYALDFLGSGITISSGASGNLRDSTPDSFVYSSTTYPLYHVCPHFEQLIAVLENA